MNRELCELGDPASLWEVRLARLHDLAGGGRRALYRRHAVPDARREHNIVLVLMSGAFKRLKASIAIFEETIASVTTLSGVYYVDDIPKSELGKIKSADLVKLLGY